MRLCIGAAAEAQGVRGRDEVAPVSRIVNVILAVSLLGCGSTHQAVRSDQLSEDEALELAVVIANTECMDKFGQAPFETSSYTIEFREGRWFWGSMDAHGIGGFSAMVSFDVRGDDRQATVFFSYDQLEPVDVNDER